MRGGKGKKKARRKGTVNSVPRITNDTTTACRCEVTTVPAGGILKTNHFLKEEKSEKKQGTRKHTGGGIGIARSMRILCGKYLRGEKDWSNTSAQKRGKELKEGSRRACHIPLDQKKKKQGPGRGDTGGKGFASKLFTRNSWEADLRRVNVLSCKNKKRNISSVSTSGVRKVAHSKNGDEREGAAAIKRWRSIKVETRISYASGKREAKPAKKDKRKGVTHTTEKYQLKKRSPP